MRAVATLCAAQGTENRHAAVSAVATNGKKQYKILAPLSVMNGRIAKNAKREDYLAGTSPENSQKLPDFHR
jgi:hypothetical protein